MTRCKRAWTGSRRWRQRAGFTLFELLVSLVVGAVVILGARLMVEGVADGARRIARQARRMDREANAERLLRATVAAMEAGRAVGESQFGGNGREAHFTSWCDTPGGWQERCTAILSISSDTSGVPGGGALTLSCSGAEPVRVRAGFMHGELRYLADAHDGGHWFTSWGTGLAAPLAIGVILDRDTLILKVGERG